MNADEDLRPTVAALVRRVRDLEDQAEIIQLVSRYGPAVDSGEARAAAELWTEDGQYEAPPYAVWKGHDQIAGMVESGGHQQLITNGCAHVLTTPVIRLDGDEATAWNYAQNIRWDADAGRFWVARLSANTWHLRRDARGWRVVTRVNRNLDGADEARALLRGSVSGF